MPGQDDREAGGRAPIARRLAATLAGLRARLSLLWLLFAAIVVFGLTGTLRVQFDDELLRFFSSDLAAYLDYRDVVRDFESDTNDVIVLVEAEDLAEPAALAAISDFLLDAQFLPDVRAAVSPLALEIAGPDGRAEPLVPFPLPDRATMAARFERARAETPALAQLMAADRSAMILILSMASFGEGRRGARIAAIDALHALGGRAEAASGVRVRLSGYTVLRDSIARALTRDMLVLNVIGIAVGFMVAVVALRSVRLGLLTLPGVVMAVLTTMGLFGYLGVAINTVTITLPVLVVVLAASDTIHISFERGRQGGRDTRRATIRAIRRVAVACVFAAATTAVAFGALATSRSEIIAEMGRMGVLVTLVSVAVVLLTQTLVLTAAGHFAWFVPLFERLERRPPTGLFFARLPGIALAHPRPVAWGAVGLLVLATVFYAQAGPRYSMFDSLRPGSEVISTFRAIEREITPVSLIQVPVASADPAVVARVHDAVADITGASGIQSIGHLEAVAGRPLALADLPAPLAARLVSADGSRALVNLPFLYESGDATLALSARIDAGLAADPTLAGIGVGTATGMPVMSAKVAGTVLMELNRSLLIALVAVAILIFAWLGNARVALISLIPNMLPVALIGAWLALSGRGIEFSNGLALTVAFGIAVDDTLHVLNRLRLSGGVAQIDQDRLAAALHEVTPALVTTSAVLILGVGGSVFAATKSVADFGVIAIAVYLLALIADLLVLPASLATFGPKSYLRKRKEPA